MQSRVCPVMIPIFGQHGNIKAIACVGTALYFFLSCPILDKK